MGQTREPASSIECVLLHVEDDDASAYLFQAALRRTTIAPKLFRVTDGEHAMLFLQEGPYSGAQRPNLILLDLNLRGKSGFDVLAEIKISPRLRDLKVVVFSTSDVPEDREKSLELGADDYLLKNGNFDDLVKAAESICRRLQ